MNYTQLSAAITAYTEDQNFLSSDIDTFIKQAEQRVYNSINLLPLRKNVIGQLTASNKYLTVPDDFLAVYNLSLILPTGDYAYLLDKDVSYIREAYPSSSGVGQPTHYALFDEDTVLFGPTPDAAYQVEMHYFYYPESITTVVSGETWLGNNFDSVLLYGALIEAYTFMKGEKELMDQYQRQYDTALALLKQLGDGKNRQDTYRTGQVRYPVK